MQQLRLFHLGLGILAVFATLRCTPDRRSGQCGESSECPEGQVCLYDVDRQTNFCAAGCTTNQDCESDQICPASLDPNQARYCVSAVRACQATELCNGLDDDCDGVIDNEGCEIITGCLDDQACGAFVCTAPPGQVSTVCAPKASSATVPNYSVCTTDAQCDNETCIAGICSPYCRPNEDCGTAIFPPTQQSQDMRCAEAYRPDNRPAHNVCQFSCGSTGDCGDELACVWRSVYQGGEQHYFVCSSLDETRLPLGSACPNNLPEDGDRRCQHGLCFGQVCTRSCSGPGEDCTDIGADFVCELSTLFYGSAVFGDIYLCVKDTP